MSARGTDDRGGAISLREEYGKGLRGFEAFLLQITAEIDRVEVAGSCTCLQLASGAAPGFNRARQRGGMCGFGAVPVP